jgi:hypothetical protein
MYNKCMLTNINLDETVVAEAMRLTGARTKREVVDRALRELVARAKRPDVASLLGLGGLDLQYDHKVARGGDAWMRVEEPRLEYGVARQTTRQATPAAAQQAKRSVARVPKSAPQTAAAISKTKTR